MDAARAATAASRAKATGSFEQQCNQIEADMAYILAGRDTSRWETEDLLQRADALAVLANSPLEKERLATLRKKIVDADNVRKNSLALDNAGAMQSAPSSAPVLLPAPPVSLSAPSQFPEPYTTTPGRWDYQGILVRVQPQRAEDFSLPRYALTDEKGLVRCFVTPPEGMDFAQYEGKKVALAGTRSYLKSQRAFHLRVREVVSARD